LSVPLVKEVRLPVGALLRAAEPYPTYMLTAAAAGMGSSALNSLMDHRTPTWGQVLEAGGISAGLSVLGAGSAAFFSRRLLRGGAEWPVAAQREVGSGWPFSLIRSRSGISGLLNWRPWQPFKAPLFARVDGGEVLMPPMTLRPLDLRMTQQGLYVRTGAGGSERVRDLGTLMIVDGEARYVPQYNAMRLPPGAEPFFAKPPFLIPGNSIINLGIDTGFFDLHPDFGSWVRHARHLTYPSAAPTPAAVPQVNLLALPEAPAPGQLPRHLVRPGDTLWGIAAQQYGYPIVYPDIAGRNRIADPDLIYPGQNLILPAVLPQPAGP
jgi:hypothetical protein